MPYKNVDDFELDGPRRMSELLQRIAPLTYRCWKGPPPKPAPPLQDGRPRPYLYPVADISGPEHVGPVHVVTTGPGRRRAQRRGALFGRLSGYVRDALASQHYTMTGIGPDGRMIDVPRDVANQVVIDLERNTLSTPEGGFVWRAIVVRMANPPVTPTKPTDILPQKVNGDGGSQTARCRADILLVFPDGKVQVSYNEAAKRIEEQTGRRYSKDVVRVALGKKKP